MSLEQWTAVDGYIADHLIPADPTLEAALAASVVAGLPTINVTPQQGKFLYLLARIQGARNILEIGTLAGYSTLWLARALPDDGRLVTLELEPKHAAVARENFERAGLASRIELRVGPAMETLGDLVAQHRGPFDLIFIDADKMSMPEYFQWAMKLSRKGTVIIADNVVRNGAVVDATSVDESVRGVRRLMDFLSTEPRVTATALQTVGNKGYDGFCLAVVNA